MIPKIIHYCWFGNNEKDDLIKKCINSWKKNLVDYEFMEWNEENFNIMDNEYAAEAYRVGKYAFVSDYVRLNVLERFGGIYLDTDVEVKKTFDKSFLENKVFLGYEHTKYVSTGIIGAEKNHFLIKIFLNYYNQFKFINENGDLNLKTNVEIITEILSEKYEFIPDNKEKEITKGVFIYPKEYFCMGKKNKNNYCIHHFNGSWLDDKMIKKYYYLFRSKYNILNKLILLKDDQKELLYLKERLNKERIYIYGLGSAGRLLFDLLEQNSIKVENIIDEHLDVWKDREILKLEQVKKCNAIVIISLAQYNKDLRKKLETKFIDTYDIFELFDMHEIIG